VNFSANDLSSATLQKTMTNEDKNLKLSRQMILTLSSIEDLNSMEDADRLFGEIVLVLKRCLSKLDHTILGVIDGASDTYVTHNSFYGIKAEELHKIGLKVGTPRFNSSILERRNRPPEEESINSINQNIVAPLSEIYGAKTLFRIFTVKTAFTNHLTFFLAITSADQDYISDRLVHNIFSLALDSFKRTLATILLKDEDRLPNFAFDIVHKLSTLQNDHENALLSFSEFLANYFGADDYLTITYESKNQAVIFPEKYEEYAERNDLQKITKRSANHIDVRFRSNPTSIFLSDIARDYNFSDATIFTIPSPEGTAIANIVLLFSQDPEVATNAKLFLDNQLGALGKQLLLKMKLKHARTKINEATALKREQNDFVIQIMNEIMPIITEKNFKEKELFFEIINTAIKWDHTIDGKLPLKNIMSDVLTQRFNDFRPRVYGIYDEYDAFKVTLILLIINCYIDENSTITLQYFNKKVIAHIQEPKTAKDLPKFNKSSIIYEVIKINDKALAINFDI